MSGGRAGGSFAANTLSSLLQAQEGSSDVAADLLSQTDNDGDGLLSASEAASTLGVQAGDTLKAAISRLDTDGDGSLSAEELTKAIEARRPPSSSDLAARLLGETDTDGDGLLSLTETSTALGSDSTDQGFTSAFGKLDTDGGGALSADELATALDAFRGARGRPAFSRASIAQVTA